MAADESPLEHLLEELCENQIKEQDLEEEVLEQVKTMDAEELNEFRRLYRLEIKRLLNDHGETDLAAEIRG